MMEGLFIGFGLFAILCAISVVFARNAVYSAFGLILCFFSLAGIYVLWGSHFIAMLQILIYTGAIVVLFVFVVMLLNLSSSTHVALPSWQMVLGAGLAVWAFALMLLRTLNYSPYYMPAAQKAAPNLKEISLLLFTEYLWPFEVLSLFMLALIVGIFALTRPEEEEEK